MEILNYLETFNNVLERSFLFRGFKAVLAFYLILMTITIALIIWRLMRAGYFIVLQTGQEYPLVKGKMQERWEEAQQWMEGNNPDEWNAAVLETARMLNEILGIVGYKGETLGEKLETMLPNQLENLEQAKEANKVKNKIVNNPNFKLSKEEVKQTVEVFADSLKYFEAIS